jgi:hypothetical protein
MSASVIVSVCALAFTVGSFWWIQVRRGNLKGYPPHSFGAVIHQDNGADSDSISAMRARLLGIDFGDTGVDRTPLAFRDLHGRPCWQTVGPDRSRNPRWCLAPDGVVDRPKIRFVICLITRQRRRQSAV